MPEAMPSPEWHGEAISDRLAKIERGEGEFPTLSQLKQRLQTSTP